MANKTLAIKLISVKVDKKLQKSNHDEHFKNMVKVKTNLCKLPIIDMKVNSFRFGGAD